MVHISVTVRSAVVAVILVSDVARVTLTVTGFGYDCSRLFVGAGPPPSMDTIAQKFLHDPEGW